MDVKTEVEPRDFSEPWKFSDVVLVVEEERFHVHRSVLAMASPVFEKMFTSEFQEKDSKEIPLPGKSSTEVKELLLTIYPLASEKQITGKNCYFLVKLAHEYQMDAIVQKCEDYIVAKLETKTKDGVLADLIFAQTYKLEKLRRASVYQANNLSLEFEELKKNKMYDQIQPANLIEIMEGIINRLQRTSQERQKKINDVTRMIQSVRSQALQNVGNIVILIFNHANSRHNFPLVGHDVDSLIDALQHDCSKSCKCRSINCASLSDSAKVLRQLKQSLESLHIA